MKRKLSIMATGVLALALLTSGSGFAASTPVAVKELSLTQSLDLALKQNPKVELLQIGVQSAQSGYDSAKYSADNTKVEAVQTYEMGKLKWFYPRQAEKGLTLAKASQEVETNGLKLEVETNYYEVLKTERKLAIKKAAYQRALDQLKIQQANVKAGTAARGDLIAVESGVAKSEADVTSAQNDYDIALLKFNKSLGADLDTKVKLTTKLSFEKAKDLDYNASLKEAVENNISILSVKEELAVKEKEFEVAQKFYAGGVATFDQAKYAAKKAEAEVRQQEQETKLAVKSAYLRLQSTEKMLAFLNKNVEKERENVRIVTLRYKAGLATNLDMTGANLSLSEAEETYTETLYQYNLAKGSIKYGIFK